MQCNTMSWSCAIHLYVLYCLHYLFWYDLQKIRRDLNTKQCWRKWFNSAMDSKCVDATICSVFRYCPFTDGINKAALLALLTSLSLSFCLNTVFISHRVLSVLADQWCVCCTVCNSEYCHRYWDCGLFQPKTVKYANAIAFQIECNLFLLILWLIVKVKQISHRQPPLSFPY